MSLQAFARDHVSQITATIGLVTYATTRKKLTFPGVLAGIFVATVHMLHPWPAFFWLLIVFFLVGTIVTKIGHTKKAYLTQSSTGGTGGEGSRTSAQVFANSGFACILIALHAILISDAKSPLHIRIPLNVAVKVGPYLPVVTKLLPIGIIAQYAAVAADTFSSELGILAKGDPFMITAPWRRVPRGTNGGVTVDGLAYGALGGALLVGVAAGVLYVSPPHLTISPSTAIVLVAAGLAGSVIDSVLGAVSQVTVTDRTTGKVVEGHGGARVRVEKGGSRVQKGMDLLTNNGVNFVMAMLASLVAMGVAWELGLGI